MIAAALVSGIVAGYQVFAAVADRLGITTGIDVLALMDAAEEVRGT